MNKINYRFRKFIASLLILTFVFSTTSLSTIIVYAKEIICKQIAFYKILADDSQQEFTDIPIIESPNISTDIIEPQTYEQSQDKTEQQKIDEYKSKLKNEIDSMSITRFIIKYNDDKNLDKLIKKLDKSFKKYKKLNGNKYVKLAVLETFETVDQEGFYNLINEGLNDGTIISVQPDYPMAVSADLSDSSEDSEDMQVDLPAESTDTSDDLPTESTDTSDDTPAESTDTSDDTPAESTDTSGSTSTETTDTPDDSSTDSTYEVISPTPIVSLEDNTQDSVLVALIDSGIDMTHPDLKAKFYINSNELAENGIDDDNNGYVDDLGGWDFFNNDSSVNDSNISDEWHGTHMAGLITNQNNVRILPIKVFEGGVAYTSDIIEAINYADSMGAKIINCSWGSRFDNPALEEAISASSALFVCATGNDLYNLDLYPVYPASYSATHENVISVASVDDGKLLWRCANYGANTVDIAAPGVDINSTWINGEYRYLSGTSMSAGIVSDIAAQVLVKYSQFTSYEIKKRLVESAVSVTGLQDKIKGGKLLDYDYALSDDTSTNTNIIDMPDTEPLREVIPDVNPNDNDYSLFGAENYVSTKASMLTARHGLQVIMLNNEIYAIGGQTSFTDGFTNVVEMYDPVTDTWTTKNPMNYPRSYFGAVLYNGKIYAIGGQSSATTYLNNVEVYDPDTDTWTLLPGGMPVAKCEFSTTLVPDTSKVYIIGGLFGSSYQNSVYMYDISTNSWTTMTSLSTPIAGQISFYRNGKINIEAGVTSTSATSTKEYRYDITAGTTVVSDQCTTTFCIDASGVLINTRYMSIGGKERITSGFIYDEGYTNYYLNSQNGIDYNLYYGTNHILTARSGLGSVYLNGKVYVIGGLNSLGAVSALEVIDLGYQPKAPIPAKRKDFETVELNGKIYIMGGKVRINGVESYTKEVHMYDPYSDQWIQTTEMPSYLKSFSIASAYGKIYVFGGYIMYNSDVSSAVYWTNKIYEYNPAQNSWAVKNSTIYRSYAKAAFYNGKIFITGGYDQNSYTNKVTQYDPLADTLVTKNDLPTGITDAYLSIITNRLYLFRKNNADVLVYDSVTDTWSSVVASGVKYGNLMVTIGDNVFALGYTNNGSSVVKSLYKYLPNDKAWTFYNSFNFFGDFQSVISANSKIYMFNGTGGYSSGLIEYCPPISPWSIKTSYPSTCEATGSVVIGNNIYISGGWSGGSYSNSLRVFNESSKWQDLPTMTYGRKYHGMGMANNKLYVIGGANSSASALNYVEEFDLASKTWAIKAAYPTTIIKMAVASYNNKVYVFGGQDTYGMFSAK